MKLGIELGIRAPKKAIEKAAEIAEEHLIDYFFVPETHPKFYGVDAFETLSKISENIKHVKLGTVIVNIFSRSKKRLPNMQINCIKKQMEILF